ncbi:MAG: hypothetical protein ACKVOB_13360 [Sphingomonas sp.]
MAEAMTDKQNPHPLGLTAEEVALSYTTKDAPLVRYGAQNSEGVAVGSEHIKYLNDKLKRRKGELAACERMIELLQPEWDLFEARNGHNLYVARDYADHFSAARKHREEIVSLEGVIARITELEAHIAAEPERMLAVVEAERERCAQFAYSWYDGEPEVAEDLRAAIRTQGTSHPQREHEMSELICIKCTSKNVFVARDMKSTRHCGNCHCQWLPEHDGKVASSADLRAKLDVARDALESIRDARVAFNAHPVGVIATLQERATAALATIGGTDA